MCSVNWFELKWLFHIFPWSKHASDPTPPYLGLTANMTLSKSVDPPFTLMTLPTYVVWLQKITFYLYPCVVCLSYCFKEVFDIFIFFCRNLTRLCKVHTLSDYTCWCGFVGCDIFFQENRYCTVYIVLNTYYCHKFMCFYWWPKTKLHLISFPPSLLPSFHKFISATVCTV